MVFELGYSPEVDELITTLETSDPAKYKKVVRALKRLEQDPHDPALNSSKYQSLKGKGPGGTDIWESYVEQGTPGAWRVFWYFSKKERGLIGVIHLGPHP